MKKNKLFYIGIAICSTFWIIFNYIPYIPLGAILCLTYVLFKKRYKLIALIVAFSIIGFIGTGVSYSVNMAQSPQNKAINGISTNINFNLGTGTIEYLINKDKITIFDDNWFEEDIRAINDIKSKEFIQSYNSKDFETIYKLANITNATPNSEEIKKKVQETINQMHDGIGKIGEVSYLGYQVYKEKGNDDGEYVVYYQVANGTKKENVSLQLKYYKQGGEIYLTGNYFIVDKKYNIIRNMKKRTE